MLGSEFLLRWTDFKGLYLKKNTKSLFCVHVFNNVKFVVTVQKFRRLQSSVRKSENIERFHVNKVPGQLIFSAAQKFEHCCVNVP